jgi:hypothetical protein
MTVEQAETQLRVVVPIEEEEEEILAAILMIDIVKPNGIPLHSDISHCM